MPEYEILELPATDPILAAEQENPKNEILDILTGQGFSGRPDGKATWRENIRILREKADMYEALLYALPDTLSEEANEALWLMAYKVLQHP